MGPFLEMMMLICFGLSWPVHTWKAYKAKTAKNMSLPFIILIILGYVAGISRKFIIDEVDFVLVAYFLNLAVVLINLVIYFKNLTFDKRELCKA